MPQTIETYRHPFADGGFKRMLINGEWVRSASGKTFETINPSTGELLGTVAEGDKEDIDRAVATALSRVPGQSSSPTSDRRCCSKSVIWSRKISRS
jgi:aldehyde dehydrogenase (NAD+)